MTTQEVFSMLALSARQQARALNFVGYVAWGGEPLMRKETQKILRYEYDLGFFTSMITAEHSSP
jgi:MoaA/NifB/PqqE/SkfB family radical SAM enzyme